MQEAQICFNAQIKLQLLNNFSNNSKALVQTRKQFKIFIKWHKDMSLLSFELHYGYVMIFMQIILN